MIFFTMPNLNNYSFEKNFSDFQRILACTQGTKGTPQAVR